MSSNDIDFIKNEEIEINQMEQKILHLTNQRKVIELELISRVNATVAKSIIITPQTPKGANIKISVENGSLIFQDIE